jgi:hypothetical protein
MQEATQTEGLSPEEIKRKKKREYNRRYVAKRLARDPGFRAKRIAVLKAWKQNNKERVLEIRRRWEKHPKRIEWNKKYKKENAARLKEYRRSHRAKNRMKAREYDRVRRVKKGDQIRAYNRKYYADHPEKMRAKYQRQKPWLKARHKHRMETEPHYRMRFRLSVRIWEVIRKQGTIKRSKTLNLLGCSLKEFVSHIEAQFKPGMSWANYGKNGWWIDHIKPCAKFDLSDPVQQFQCFHYSNLQPLWWRDNIVKSDKIAA